MDMIILTINIVEMNVIIGLIISMVDVGVIKQIMKDMGSVDESATYVHSYICSKYFWGNHQNNTDTQQPK